MASPLPPLLLLLLLLLLLSVLSTAKPKLSFTTELIHRDSPRSPYYNSSLSPADRLHEAARRSIDLSRRRGFGLNDFSTPVYPNRFEYLMSLSLGTPPFEVLAIPDTGSDLIWVQCEPCDSCYKQNPPKFNPSGSSTYRDVPCETNACSAADLSYCSDDHICQYHVNYGDGSYSTGLLATDTLTFSSGNRRPISIPRVSFGCTHGSKGTFAPEGGGLVGLGSGHISLISQLRDSIDGKFSYCLVPYSDDSKSSSITLGSTVSGTGTVTTPILDGVVGSNKFYFLSLDSITVAGGKEVPLQGADEGNIIIDSGTTLTLLPKETTEAVVSALSSMVKLPRVPDPSGVFDLCFHVGGNTTFEDFPELAFNFRGAEVRLPVSNTFLKVKDRLLCLAIRDSGGVGTPIFGNVAQQNFHVGYDLVNKEVSFLRTDCTKVA